MMLCIVVSVAVLASWTSAGIVRDAERHQVIVVGAGVSGFTAAATLLEHNVTDILVLEASDRIGGRIHTVQFGGVSLEKGAEFVHGQKNNSVYELLEPFNFLTSQGPLVTADKLLFINMSDSTVMNSTYISDVYDEASEIMYADDLKHFNGSMADYFFPRLDEFIQSKNIEPRLGEALHHIVPLRELLESVANDLSQLGAWGLTDCAPIEGNYELVWKPGSGGYKNLFNILSKKFPNPSKELPVRNKTVLGKQVTLVERREGEGDVKVTCADGSTYLADHVIVTVSLGVLKKHAATMFQPALPAAKTKAIEALGFGCLAKVFLLFPYRWWPHSTNAFIPMYSKEVLRDFQTNSKYGNWTSYTTGFLPVINHDRILYAWFSGAPCWNLDNLSEEHVIDGLVELLTKMVGDKFQIPRPEAILRSGWGTYPFTLGSYSFRSVDSDRLNITNSDLAEPILEGEKPVVLFAGEATNHDFASFVHGALDTGRREAQNIINYLNKHS